MTAIAVGLMTMAAAVFSEGRQLLVNNANYVKVCGIVTVLIIWACIIWNSWTSPLIFVSSAEQNPPVTHTTCGRTVISTPDLALRSASFTMQFN